MRREVEPRDMGPFKDMDPRMIDAISRYGTPPYRQLVTEYVRDVGGYSFDELPTTIPAWIDWFRAAESETPAPYRPDLKCGLEFDSGYYDSGGTANLQVWYNRPETDAEMIDRVNRGIAYVTGQAQAERRQYEALKAKFGDA